MSPSHATWVLQPWYVKQMHLVEWLSSLSQQQTNCVLLPAVRSFLSYFIFSGKCKRTRWCLTKGKIVRFCPNNIPEYTCPSRQFIYIWLYHAIQWANSAPAAFTLRYQNCPSGAQLKSPRYFLVLKIVGKVPRMWPLCNRTPWCGWVFGVIGLLLCFVVAWSSPDVHADPPCNLIGSCRWQMISNRDEHTCGFC